MVIEPNATIVFGSDAIAAGATALGQLKNQAWDASSLNSSTMAAVDAVLNDMQDFVDVITTLISDWTNERDVADAQLTSYKAGFALDESFIR
jgi:hypothetical protein